MTREEAIERIVDHMEVHHIGEYPHVKLAEALDMALSALRPVSREQIEKVWPGCNICENVKLERIGITQDEIYTCDPDFIDSNDQFLYCPKCGKPITEKAWQIRLNELEEALND